MDPFSISIGVGAVLACGGIIGISEAYAHPIRDFFESKTRKTSKMKPVKLERDSERLKKE
jgi:hypothetical protein